MVPSSATLIPEPILTAPSVFSVALGKSSNTKSSLAPFLRYCPSLPSSGRITFSISSIFITVPSAAIEYVTI